MIVVLCDDFWDAEIAFTVFMEYLHYESLTNIVGIWEAGLCVDTDDDLRYIFIDHHFKNLFNKHRPDFIDVEEFFEDMDVRLNYFG